MLRLITIGTFCALLFSFSTLRASVCFRLSFDNLVEQSDRVVVAQLTGEGGSAWGPKKLRIFTTYHFRVTEEIAGSGPSVFTIVQPGGRVGRWEQVVRGYPRFKTDDKLVIFLRKTGHSFKVVGLSQGVFSFQKDSNGCVLLHQELNGLSLVSSPKQPPTYGRSMVTEPTLARKRIRELWQKKKAP